MKYKGKGEHSVNQLENIIEFLIEEKSQYKKSKFILIEALEDFVNNESEILRHLYFANELADDYKYLFDQARNALNPNTGI